MPQPLPSLSSQQRGFAVAVLAIVMGFLGANVFADAVGIAQPTDRNAEWNYPLRFLCGVIVGLGTIALVIAAGHYSRLLAALLGSSRGRPGPGMNITLLICGTVCLLSALGFEWFALSTQGTVRSSASVEKGVEVSASLGQRSAPLPHAVAIGVFLAGGVLIGIGIWGAIAAPAGDASEEAPEPDGTTGEARHPTPMAGV